MMKRICINDFVTNKEDPHAFPAAVSAAVCAAADGPAELVLRPGEYHIYSRDTACGFYHISNNDPGEKSILFHLRGCKNLTIDGGGAVLIFHGRTIAFCLSESEDIRLRGFTVRQARPFFTQGEIVGRGERHVDVRIDRSRFPFSVVDEKLIFWGDEWDSDFLYNFLEYDETGYTAFDAGDHHYLTKDCRASLQGEEILRLRFSRPHGFRVGNTLVIEHEKRVAPAVFVDRCRECELEDIRVEGCSAMAFIAQHSEDVTLRRCAVAPREESGCYISACADGSHFVNCRGKVRLLDCLFSGQMDDGTNVHGIYAVVGKQLAPDCLLLKLGHVQQYGQVYIRAGDQLEFCDPRTLETVGTARAAACVSQGEAWLLLRTEEPLDFPCLGCGVENISACPDVEIRGCRVEKNRARSILLSVRGRIVVEDNDFSSGGAAIHISGDTNFWFESGRVQNALIRGNRFLNCRRFTGWGDAVVNIVPEIPDPRPGVYYHRGITLENNRFLLCDSAAVRCENTQQFRMSGNEFVMTGDYPVRQEDLPRVALKNTESL